MNAVLYQKINELIDSVLLRFERINNDRAVMKTGTINSELSIVKNAIKSILDVQDSLEIRGTEVVIKTEQLLESIDAMINKQQKIGQEFDDFNFVLYRWAQLIRQQSNKKSMSQNLKMAAESNKILIGMLTEAVEPLALETACAYVARYEDVDFFKFATADIDYKNKIIVGHFYENNEWVEKFTRYPDAVYDRLRLRGIKGLTRLYDELDGIPFTNERHGNSISKLEVYDIIKSSGQFDQYIIPYDRVTSVDIILEYLDRYKSIILKPEIGSFGKQVFFITETEDQQFFIAERGTNSKLSKDQFLKFLSTIVETGQFIVQRYIMSRTKEKRPFDIRVHVMKDGLGKWSIVIIYPRVGIHFAVISSTGDGGYIGGWPGFIKRNFPYSDFEKVDNAVRTLSLNIANTFETFSDERINEVALDIAIDQDLNLYLIELNANKPGVTYHQFDVARHAIPYAISLAKQNAVSVNHSKN